MTNRIKRLRLFAGPNGSGKSTLYDYLIQIKAFHSYYHINADMIARDLPVSLNLDNWPIDFSMDELKQFLDLSSFQSLVHFRLSEMLTGDNRGISLKDPSFNNVSYLAAAVADFLRIKMLRSASSFSFESVFSHASKIQELENAKKENYRIYLYFIATENSLVNVQRVQNRAKSGGHDVPTEKISARYLRTMNNLYVAFKLADRAYLFDNSEQKAKGSFDFFAEKNGKNIYVSESHSVPQWFEAYIVKHL